MQKSEIVLDKSKAPLRFVGRRADAQVPRYFLYGDTEPTGDWLINVEQLDERCRKNGWVIAPHAHPHFVQIIVVLAGGGAMTAEGEPHPFTAPALLVVSKHAVHGFKYEENSRGWVLTISERYLEVLEARAPALSGIWSVPTAFCNSGGDWVPAAEAALRELDRELDEGEIGGVIAAEALLTTFLVLILRQFAKAGELGKPTMSGGTEALVSRYRALIEDHYRDNWALAKYAQSLNVSVAQLRSACLSSTGEAPLKLIHERILTEAKRNLVYSAHSIAQIAYLVGFNDPAYFSRFFTRHVGEPPTEFRASKAFTQP